MKKRFLIITALIGLLVSCRDPASDHPDNVINNPEPNQKTIIVFDNRQGICTAVVYDDYRRRGEDKVAEIPAGAISQEIEWTPGTSVPFYFSYRVSLKGVSGFILNYVPEVGKDQTAVRIDTNTKTTISIPKLEETVSSPDTLLSNNSFILIQNNSSFSFQLHRGSSPISPDGLSNSLVNSGERAQYTINPGAASNYRLLVGADYITFSSSLVSFEAGRVYSFIFDGGVNLASEVEIKLENIAGVSPNNPVPQAPGAPVIMASDGLLTVRWTAIEGAEQYEVYRSTAQNPPALPERTVYSSTTVLTGLTNKTTYYVWVKAANENGASDFSPRARGIPWPANEVPATPERPVIIPGVNQITVNWEESGGASSYEVYINTTTATPSTPVVTSDKTSAVITRLGSGDILENDVIYYIWVRAVNSRGRSGYSPVEAGTPRIPTVAPATPGRQVLTAGSREIAVSWQAVELAAAYEVWFGTSDNPAQAVQFGGDIRGGITEAVITGLTNETTYYVWIKAKNIVGESDFSLPASTKPSAFLVMPETPDMPTVIPGNRELFVSWQSVEGTLFYEIWAGVTNNPANAGKHGADVSGTSTTLTGLDNGTTYYVWLRAKNNIGTGNFSAMASGIPSVFDAIPLAPLSAPSVSTGNTQLVVNWLAVEGAISYEIWMGTTINQTLAEKRGNDVPSPSGTITGLTNGTTYYVWIKAKNNVGTSDFSPMASGKPIANMGAVTLVSGNGQLTASWSTVVGADQYEVYYSTNNSIPTIPAQTVSTTTVTISGLANGTTYYVWVRGKNTTGAGSASTVVNGNPLGTPGAPTVSPAYKQLLVTWTAVPGADEYEVYYGTGTPTTLVTTTTGTTATIAGLNNGTTYYVRLRAKNTNGISDYGPNASNSPSVTPGLYRGAEKIGTQNLNASLSYISSNAASGNDFYIVLGADESVSPMNLSYSGKTVGITLIGYGGERTITLASNGRMFLIPSGNTGVTLTLNENITLVGLSTNNYSLVYLDSGKLVINDGTKISGNTSSGRGGGIYISGNSTVTINGGTISGNIASSGGGGIGVVSNGTLIMNGGTISGNEDKGGYGGGGIYVDSNGTLTIHDGIISGNTAARYGGGVYMYTGSPIFTMHGGVISGNTAGDNGGGVCIYSGTFKKLPIGGGQNSGIIYGNEETGVDAGGVPLKNTSGNNNGHAVYLSSSARRNTTAGQTVQIDSTTGMGLSESGEQNISPGLYRGAEKIGNQNLSASLSYISSNAVSGDDFYIVLGANESTSPMTLSYSGKTVGITLIGYGGERTITLASNGSMFNINTGVTLTLDENIKLVGINTNNAALVRVNSNGTFTMNSGTISGNTTNISDGSNYGGGIYVVGGTFTMNGGTISGNKTISNSNGSYGSRGGGIYVASGTFTMNSGTISGNTVSGRWDDGGWVFLGGGTFTMNGGTISGNTANNGGGIYMQNVTVSMHGGIISGNIASSGGGIYVGSSAFFKKLPSGGGQNSGIIYGNEETGVDAGGVPLKNTSGNSSGHAVYSSSGRRNTTAGQTDPIDSTTGRGLSANGNAPFGQ